MRIVVLAVALCCGLILIERQADACCVGCPCTKYKRQVMRVELPPSGYSHSVPGAVPRWSVARITRFLTSGNWKPYIKGPRPEVATPKGTIAEYLPPATIRFMTADKAGEPSNIAGRVVLIRRIEKHGSAILIEVNDRIYRLAGCTGKTAGSACLVDPGGLTLAPVAVPTEPTDKEFAQPPPQ